MGIYRYRPLEKKISKNPRIKGTGFTIQNNEEWEEVQDTQMSHTDILCYEWSEMKSIRQNALKARVSLQG